MFKFLFKNKKESNKINVRCKKDGELLKKYDSDDDDLNKQKDSQDIDDLEFDEIMEILEEDEDLW